MSEYGETKREREFKARLNVLRENRDRGWRDMLATPAGRTALYELYAECMAQKDAVVIGDDASVPMTFRAIGKRAIGDWLANRCKLADHRNWLLLLAENDEAFDDGRAQERQNAEEGE